MQRLLVIAAQIGSAEDIGIPVVRANKEALGSVMSGVFLLVGALSVIFIVVGGFRYVVSGGDPRNTQQAKNTIIYAVIGLFISVFAFAIVNFIVGRF